MRCQHRNGAIEARRAILRNVAEAKATLKVLTQYARLRLDWLAAGVEGYDAEEPVDSPKNRGSLLGALKQDPERARRLTGADRGQVWR